MNGPKAFDRRIRKFLNEQPDSDSSKIIKLIMNSNGKSNDYYSVIENFVNSIGFRITVDDLFDDKKSKTIGYIPFIIHPVTTIGINPKIEQLAQSNSPLKLTDSYTLLAKELIYRLIALPNIEELINKRHANNR